MPRRLGERLQLFSDAGGIGHGLRREDDKQSVGAGAGGHDLDRLRVSLRRSVAQHVDRIGVVPVRGQHSIEASHRFGGELRQLATTEDERVGGQDGRTAGVGHDG